MFSTLLKLGFAYIIITALWPLVSLILLAALAALAAAVGG
jgi:hypothetical protein